MGKPEVGGQTQGIVLPECRSLLQIKNRQEAAPAFEEGIGWMAWGWHLLTEWGDEDDKRLDKKK